MSSKWIGHMLCLSLVIMCIPVVSSTDGMTSLFAQMRPRDRLYHWILVMRLISNAFDILFILSTTFTWWEKTDECSEFPNALKLPLDY